VTNLVPTYRPAGSPLHRARPTVAIAYIASLCVVVPAYDHPLVLVAALAAICLAGVGAGVAGELARAARLALPLVLLVVAINPLVSHDGLTVLAVGPTVPVLGTLEVTLEALTWGAVAGLRVLTLILAFALYSAAVDPDQVLRLFRRVSFRSALTASLATRLVPTLAHDAERLALAYSLRAARPARDEGRFAQARRASTLTRALAAGALERAVDLAAALEVRGYAGAKRSRAAFPRPWSAEDLLFAAAALAIVALAAGGLATGLLGYDVYPRTRADLDLADVALALAIPLAFLAPFAAARRMRDSHG
jgi:energy-coupling factor transport system permease protein